jgi:zinc transport system permease protein
LASLGIEKIRKLFPKYSELSIAIILSTGVGLAGVLSGFVNNSASFTSFLFGSIVAISNFEVLLVAGLSIVVLLITIFLYKELFYITFDEESARLAGIPVKLINFIFILLTAITISISARTIGTLVISSLLILPVASAMQISKSYKQTMIYAVIIAVIAAVAGLFISFYANLKPGGTIVLISVAILLLIAISKKLSHFRPQ